MAHVVLFHIFNGVLLLR